MMKGRTLLMIPGPIEFERSVLQALGAPTMSRMLKRDLHVSDVAAAHVSYKWRGEIF